MILLWAASKTPWFLTKKKLLRERTPLIFCSNYQVHLRFMPLFRVKISRTTDSKLCSHVCFWWPRDHRHSSPNSDRRWFTRPFTEKRAREREWWITMEPTVGGALKQTAVTVVGELKKWQSPFTAGNGEFLNTIDWLTQSYYREIKCSVTVQKQRGRRSTQLS